MYDVAVIGAGVTGCFIAKELSKYEVSVVVFEKKSGVGLLQTKGCSGVIHAFQFPFSSLRGRLCLEGNKIMDREASELGFEFKRVGLLLLATNEVSKLMLPIVKRLLSRHLDVRAVSREEILATEPNVTERVRGGLLLPSAGVVNPVEMTFTAFLFAKLNGVDFVFDCEVTGIERRLDRFVIETSKGKFEARFVVNCAGVYADEVARMVGYDLQIKPSKGSHVVFGEKGFTNHMMAAIPLKPKRITGGALVSVDGKPVWGPNFVEVDDKEDTSVTREDIEGIIEEFSHLFRRLPEKPLAYYAGVMATAGKDFVINQPIRNFINVAGIQSPGLTAAPAIAKLVVRMLATSGLKLKRKQSLARFSLRRFAKMSDEERAKLVAEDPRYGRVVCLCNLVTEAEIEEILKHTPCFDIVKHVTRAGMDCCECHADIIIFIQRKLGYSVKDQVKSDLAWRR
ncbi:MAG: FAD-dependent oxidoreductase [Archaeoglobaceae archaeon]